MLKNIPYFRNLDNYIIQELVYLLRPKRYEAGTLIVQRGDEVDSIYLLKTGCIVVEVPEKNQQTSHDKGNSIYLDWLNEGSCFCIYTGFSKDMYQLVNFRAGSTSIVESISIKDLRELEKNHIQLSDILKQMEIEILNGEKSDLDFFRFKPPRTKEIPQNIKKLIRKKFRDAIINFCKQYKLEKRQMLPPLEALKQFQEERNIQMIKLNELKFNSIREKKKLISDENLKDDPVKKPSQTSVGSINDNNADAKLKNMSKMLRNQQQMLSKIEDILVKKKEQKRQEELEREEVQEKEVEEFL